MTPLPNRLRKGDEIQTCTGHRCTVAGLSGRDSFDEPTYRLQHPSGIVGNRLWSRDELAELGCLAERGNR